MHQAFYDKISGIRTDEVVDILVQLDNGLYDSKVENMGWYGKLEDFREAAIEVLIKRYLRYYEHNEKKNYNLDRAYNIYLKYYI